MVVLAVAGTTSGCHEAVQERDAEPPVTGEFDAVRAPGTLSGSFDMPERSVRASVVEYGQSVEGRTLWLSRIAGPAPRSGLRPAVLLMGGSQGGEELGVLDHLADAFRGQWLPTHLSPDGGRALTGAEDFLERGGVIYVVPTVNPDGVAARTYTNANGANLNRDWAAQSQPETRYLVEYLRAEAEFSGVDLRLAVDYHIGIPRLLYPRADSRTPIPFTDLAGHLTYHELMPERIRKVPISLYDSVRELYASAPTCALDNDCVLPQHCLDGEWNCGCLYSDEWDGGRCVTEPADALQIEREGLSNDFFYDAFGAMAFVYEADPETDFNNVYDHAVWWDRNLAYLATGDLPAQRGPALDVRDVISARIVQVDPSELVED